MDGGLDGFIAPEIIKKELAMKLVTDERDGDCILAGPLLIKADDTWYHNILAAWTKMRETSDYQWLRTSSWSRGW